MNSDSHRVLSAIQRHIARGEQPTYRLLSTELRLGVSNVHGHVQRLAERGLLEIRHGSGRAPAIVMPDGIEIDVLDRLSDDGLRRTADRITAILVKRLERAA